ncbi:DUF3576 domain-containing protein [Rhodophyticola sp. CCM32]|uniref:DUF3576 domain-containing protein n=1 Tax=Rhodophyticola sp. CCM32 TaxID=2916397 RepID=UPI00107F437D|nr:DUF3576 domain-containing protein [Rhodophyticola sp. CCM32]QBY01837.1 DUF3576 domain-containing protein [Rhodophyticola sp. CCM32]
MTFSGIARILCGLLLVSTVAACGGRSGGLFGGGLDNEMSPETRERLIESGALEDPDRNTVWDLFQNTNDPNVTVEVSRYLWNASLEILDFMPIEGADPFSGVIVFGYGTPPGSGRAYRATVYITDPALDARSLRVALQSRGGTAVSRETARQIEDAILTRARQLRIRDADL